MFAQKTLAWKATKEKGNSMNNRIVTCVITALALTTFEVCAGEEKEIPIDEVPGLVLSAARDAVPNIQITEAEVETEDGKTVYELEGTVGADSYEIEVDSEGNVLEVEKESSEPDDDDED
jgi:hypothetical protein